MPARAIHCRRMLLSVPPALSEKGTSPPMLRRSALTAVLAAPSERTPQRRRPDRAQAPRLSPPVKPVQDTYFGTTVTDPYRWMENLERPGGESLVPGSGGLHGQPCSPASPDAPRCWPASTSSTAAAPTSRTFRKTARTSFTRRLRPQDDNFKLYVRARRLRPRARAVRSNAAADRKGRAHVARLLHAFAGRQPCRHTAPRPAARRTARSTCW